LKPLRTVVGGIEGSEGKRRSRGVGWKAEEDGVEGG
jgi:hypothetical protein